MLQPRLSSHLPRAILNSTRPCLRNQIHPLFRQNLQPLDRRTLTTTPLLRLPEQSQDKQQPTQPTQPTQTPETTEPAEADADAEFVPKPLGRPIGFPTPPKAGENTGVVPKKTYTGTLKEKNLSKRKDLAESWGQNYFRDFKNIRKYRSGKTFIANPRIFRRDVSLYFPNLRGETLAQGVADTTEVLKGKVSVVRLYSSQWGLQQVATFTGTKENRELHEVLKEEGQTVQMVDVNVEENTMKAWVIALFKWKLRRERRNEDWGRYFIIRKGVSQRIRETIGALNGRVGYVYLLDENCRIRWAGSADAEGSEAEDLTRGLRRLVQEAKDVKSGKLKPRIRSPREKVDEELEAQAVNAGAS